MKTGSAPASPEDFFDPQAVANVQLQWERSLEPLAP